MYWYSCFLFRLLSIFAKKNLQLFSMTTPIYIKQYFIMLLYISNHMIDAIFTCANPNTWPHTIIYQSIRKILAIELLAYSRRCYFRKTQNENEVFWWNETYSILNNEAHLTNYYNLSIYCIFYRYLVIPILASR